MHDQGDVSQLLRQVPLTISPYVHIPSAVTLPYSYQPLPLGLPPPSTTPAVSGPSPSSQEAPSYITSPSGAIATTPEAISQTCRSLLQHLQAQKASAEQAMADWDRSIQERELAEKRRVAPGYLDTGIQLLEPIRKHGAEDAAGTKSAQARITADARSPGEELDRVFGN